MSGFEEPVKRKRGRPLKGEEINKRMRPIIIEAGVPKLSDALADVLAEAVEDPNVCRWMEFGTEDIGDQQYYLRRKKREMWEGDDLLSSRNKSTRGIKRRALSSAMKENPALFIQLFRAMPATQREFMIRRVNVARVADVIDRYAEDRRVLVLERYRDTEAHGIPVDWVLVNKMAEEAKNVEAVLRQKEYDDLDPETQETIEFGAELIKVDAQAVALQMLQESVAKAAMIKAQGLDSRNEMIRQGVATELLQWQFGRPGVRELTTGEDKYESLLRRIAEASESAAGLPSEVEGTWKDVSDDKTIAETSDGGVVQNGGDNAERDAVAATNGQSPNFTDYRRGESGEVVSECVEVSDLVNTG